MEPIAYSVIMKYCSDGWPEKHRLPPTEKVYGESTLNAGLLFGKRIVVPQALQAEMLAKLHRGIKALRGSI